MKKKLVFVFSLIIIFLLAGCNFPTGEDEPTAVDEELIRTSVAETFAAKEAEVTVVPSPVPEDTQPPPAEDTPALPPTETVPPPPTLTHTPSLTPSYTPSHTSSVPIVTVSVDTNCRVGPGVAYDQIGVLLKGETAVVVAQEESGNYWIIENPDRSGTCWLWAEYAVVTGNPSGLPLLTPPPSPTPSPTATLALAFTVNFDNYHDCGGTQYLTFYVKNNGSIPLHSADVAVVEIATLAALFDGYTDVPFVSAPNGCPPELTSLGPSGVAYIAVPVGPSPPPPPNSGTHAAAINICSEDGLNGLCLLKEFNFTIP